MNPDEIVEKYYSRVYKLSLYHLQDETEAGDITHDIFYKVIRSLDTFQGRADVYTWIYRIALNTIRNHIRRKKIVRFISLENGPEEAGEDISVDFDDPAAATEKDQENMIRIRMLKGALKKLSERERTAFYFFYYEKLKQKKIAEIMGTSVSAVESLVFKAMRKIKKKCGVI